jgi:GNAT superfamily N-acetyltransferase
MKLIVKDISETAVRQFLSWKYAPPYHLYNMSRSNNPDVQAALDYFLNPTFEFHTLYAEDDQLVGFFSFGSDAQVPGGDYTLAAIDIGLAVHPDYTGRGLGIHFAQTAVSYAIDTYHPPRLRVTIAEFNVRAQKVWQRLSFVKSKRFEAVNGKRPFLLFIKEVTDETSI